MLALVATEATLFAYLLFSYFYLASHSPPPWPPTASTSLTLAIPGSLVLMPGSVTDVVGRARDRTRRRLATDRRIRAVVLLGIAFIVLEGSNGRQPYTLSQQRLQLAVLHHHRFPFGACTGRLR